VIYDLLWDSLQKKKKKESEENWLQFKERKNFVNTLKENYALGTHEQACCKKTAQISKSKISAKFG
jgi:hypothetical protein